jgi:hypothetical protein
LIAVSVLAGLITGLSIGLTQYDLNRGIVVGFMTILGVCLLAFLSKLVEFFWMSSMDRRQFEQNIESFNRAHTKIDSQKINPEKQNQDTFMVVLVPPVN